MAHWHNRAAFGGKSCSETSVPNVVGRHLHIDSIFAANRKQLIRICKVKNDFDRKHSLSALCSNDVHEKKVVFIQ